MDQYNQYLKRCNKYEEKLKLLSRCLHTDTKEEFEIGLNILKYEEFFSQHRIEKYNWFYTVYINKDNVEIHDLGLEFDLKDGTFWIHQWIIFYVNGLINIMSSVKSWEYKLYDEIKNLYNSIRKELLHPIFDEIRIEVSSKLSSEYSKWEKILHMKHKELFWAKEIDVSHVKETDITGNQTVWTAAGYSAKKGEDRKKMQGILIKVCQDLGYSSSNFESYCDWCQRVQNDSKYDDANSRRWEDYEVLKTHEDLGYLECNRK